jgi:hypothetical protein
MADALREAGTSEEEFLDVRYLGSRFMVDSEGNASLVHQLLLSRQTSKVFDADLFAKASRFETAGRAMPWVGGLLAVGGAGLQQWHEDASDPDLSTPDRVGRSVGVGAYVGGAAIGGAVIGEAIFPFGGGLVGAAAGATGGLIFATAANAATPVKHAFADAGQWTANAAVNTVDSVGNGLKDLGGGVKSLVSHIHVPTPPIADLNPF